MKLILICFLLAKSLSSINRNDELKIDTSFIIDCDIKLKGNFKYILIKLSNVHDKNDIKYIVRIGSIYSPHSNIFRDFCNLMEKGKVNENTYFSNYFRYLPIGGGKINIDKNNILIYGTSGTYGKANHLFTKTIVEKCIPNYNIKAKT